MRRPVVAALTLLLATPALADDGPRFQTPSGNIHCEMYGSLRDPHQAGVRCDLREFTPTYSRPPECPRDYRLAFVVEGWDSGMMVCTHDSVIDKRHPVLGYGQTITHATITCHSARTGVTCTNPQGNGFMISRAKQRIF